MDAIAPFVRATPILEVPGSEIGVDTTLVFKLEHVQQSGSFKGRGAAHFLPTQPIADPGIVAASGGNHGAAVAWAAQRFGHTAHIFVPTTAAPAKLHRLERYGATIHLAGDVYADAYAASQTFLADHGATSIHAYDDPVVMAGAGTCAMELDAQAGHLDAVLVACGGGGLSGGAATWFGDRVEIVACETEGTATYASARAHGAPVDIDVRGAAADALGATRLGTHPWHALSSVDATSAVVSDEAMFAARDLLWDWLRIVVEPAAATPLAAVIGGQWRPSSTDSRVAIVLCGANTTLG
jgi:threonine dehydratase